MKKIVSLVAALMCACSLFIIPSCKKGDTGPAGPAGTPGSTVLSGSGAPATTIGKTGDFYLDLATMTMYGPKTGAGWGAGVLLKGNANVVVDTFPIAKTDWIYSAVYWFATSDGSSQGYVSKYFDHAQPLLSQDLINTGVITVQAVTDEGLQPNTYITLPYTFMENFSAAYSFNYVYTTVAGKLRIFFFFSNNNGTAPTLSTYVPPPIKVKMSLITGTAAAEMRAIMQSRSPARFIP